MRSRLGCRVQVTYGVLTSGLWGGQSRACLGVAVDLVPGQAHEEGCPFPGLSLGPNASTVFLDDASNDSQPYARSRELRRGMQTLEDAKKFVRVLHVKAHAVIANEDD